MKQAVLRLGALLLTLLIACPQGPIVRAEEGPGEEDGPSIVEEQDDDLAETGSEELAEEEESSSEEQQEPEEPQESEESLEPEESQKTEEAEPLSAPTGFAVQFEEEKLQLTWDLVPGADGYEIQYATNEKFNDAKLLGTVEDADNTLDRFEIPVFILDPSDIYYFRIRTFSETTEPGPWSEQITFELPGKLEPPAIENVVNYKEKTIKVTWSDVQADSYLIQLALGSDPDTAIKTISVPEGKFSADIEELTAEETYMIKVGGIKGDEEPVWSTPVSVEIDFYKPTLNAVVNNTSAALNVTWKKVSGASGFELQYATDSSFDDAKIVTVNGSTAVSGKISSLSRNGAYYVRIRAFKTVDGVKYDTGWTESRTATVTFFKPILSSVANKASAALNVTWKKVSGASGFELQYATDSSFKDAKIVTVNGSDAVSGKISLLARDATYYVRIRAFKMVDGVRYNTGWTASKKATVTFYKPLVKSLTNKALNAMTLKWSAVTGADGYQIRYADNSAMTSAKKITIKNGAAVSKKITKLVKYKTYYVQIRAYKSVDGKNVFSGWTTAKKIKIKYSLNYKRLNVPCRMQYPSLPNGCEAVALTNVMLFYGFSLTTDYLADHYIPRSTSNFVTKYWGNPHDSTGNSIAAPGLAMAANKYLKAQKSALKAYNLTGAKFSELLDLVEDGKPVIIWTTMYQAKLGRQYSTTQTYKGVDYKVYTNSHTVVLRGFDRKKKEVYLSDSISGYTTFDLDWIADLYAARGSQAVVIY